MAKVSTEASTETLGLARILLYAKVYLLRGFGFLVSYLVKFNSNAKPSAVEDIPTTPPIRCAFYFPPSYDSGNPQQYPVYINLHGGGFIAGYEDDDAEFCDFLAKEVGCIVVSPAYRLAPEYPFPTGLNDTYAVSQWIIQEYKTTKLAVGGTSAGGHLALGLSQLLIKSNKDVIKSVVSVYSPMNFSRTSVNTFKEKEPKIRNFYHESYLQATQGDEESLQNPLLSVNYASPDMYPESMVILAARDDPNIEDIEIFIRTIKPRIGKVYEGVFHGWLHVAERIIGKEATQKKWDCYQTIADEMKVVFA
ncbi:alpha/beta hydrolase fold [Basidiobolus ranarum]|uniref:Alpha/beta hydrolase fold n=1 Tax=Basidiobolus ranarum TaxID=34480 RepID=A0ABR2X308_9FUNG